MTNSSDDIDALPPLATHPTYSEDQLKQFLNHVGLPNSAQTLNITSLANDQKLDFLTTLLRHTLATVPFENISLHYSVTKQMLLSPALLFAKVVQGRCDDGSTIPGNKRGGYCMQNNVLFGTVLRSLGFDLVSTGARVLAGASSSGSSSGSSRGWSHMNNIVHIGKKRYLVDIGFGPNGPTIPLPLEHGFTTTQIAPAEQRIRYTRLPQHTHPDSRIWVYEHRVGPDGEWDLVYCFHDEIEFLPGDYQVMNFATSNRRDTFFTFELVCTLFTLAEEDAPDGSVKRGELDGCLILGTGLKKRKQGRSDHIVDKFASEEERLDALKKWFQIDLPTEDRAAIQGLVTEIKS